MIFNKSYKKKKEEIKSAEAEIKKMRDELDKQSELMTPDLRDEKESAYEKKVRDYKFWFRMPTMKCKSAIRRCLKN